MSPYSFPSRVWSSSQWIGLWLLNFPSISLFSLQNDVFCVSSSYGSFPCWLIPGPVRKHAPPSWWKVSLCTKLERSFWRHIVKEQFSSWFLHIICICLKLLVNNTIHDNLRQTQVTCRNFQAKDRNESKM